MNEKHEYVKARGNAALYTDRVCIACGEWEGQCPVIEGTTPTPVSGDDREAMARLLCDDNAFSDEPAGQAFDEPELQEKFEGFYAASVARRREVWYRRADVAIAAGFSRSPAVQVDAAKVLEEAANDVERMYAGSDGSDPEKAWIGGVDAAAARLRETAAALCSPARDEVMIENGDDREALGLVIEQAVLVGPLEGVSFAGRIADAILAAGFSRSPVVQVDAAMLAQTVRNDMHLVQMTANPNDPGAYVLGKQAENAIFALAALRSPVGDGQ